jgi:hypothetical protein
MVATKQLPRDRWPEHLATTKEHDMYKEGGHEVHNDIKHEIRGGLNVQNGNNGELTPGEKSRGTRHPQTIHMISTQGGGDTESMTISNMK